ASPRTLPAHTPPSTSFEGAFALDARKLRDVGAIRAFAPARFSAATCSLAPQAAMGDRRGRGRDRDEDYGRGDFRESYRERSSERSRDRDRRDRSRDDRDRDRDRDRSRDRDRDRSRDRDRPRKRGWDDVGTNPEQAALLLQQQQQFAAMQTPMQTMAGNKKQRELYVGNLPPTATELMLKELFTQLLSACEGFNPAMGPPVMNAQIAGGGQFAFIEFRDEIMCETGMLFNGIDLQGRNLKIGHPNGYMPPMQSVQTLKPPPALVQKFGLGAMAGVSASGDTKRQRELYVGNLAVGAVTSAMLKELFTAPLQAIPTSDGSTLPPVLDARVDAQARFTLPLGCDYTFHWLENLFTEAILADETEFKECVDDIKAECESFGSISNFFIPRKDDLQNRPESDVGVCFVRYEMITSAAKAYEAINGRDFDGNTIIDPELKRTGFLLFKLVALDHSTMALHAETAAQPWFSRSGPDVKLLDSVNGRRASMACTMLQSDWRATR
ncbi:MAG: hypothetical protein SGPRY_009830, partial [Prymnesium sp.]